MADYNFQEADEGIGHEPHDEIDHHDDQADIDHVHHQPDVEENDDFLHGQQQQQMPNQVRIAQ